MDTSVYLSIVVPLYNEEESAEKLLSGILEVGDQFDFPYEVILVDDGSEDRTWQIIEDLKKTTPHLRGIKFRRNYGQTNALVAGCDHALGEIIVTMDGDLQNDPADIPLLLTKIEQGYDIVSGWRKTREDKFARVILSRVANTIISITTGVRLHDYGCTLKAYRSECIKPLNAYGEMHRFFPALARMTGAQITEIVVKHHARKHGISKYGFNRIAKVLSDIFAINAIIRFAATPLKGFTICSLPFLLSSLFFGLFAFLAWNYQWTSGKAFFFLVFAALAAGAWLHLNILGLIGELVVGTSDLSHTELPEIANKVIIVNREEQPEGQAQVRDFRLASGHVGLTASPSRRLSRIENRREVGDKSN
jgi:glycosyltransferase involved in cell wall biosynthesis